MRSASCSVVSDPPRESAATGGRSPVEARGGSTLLAQARATNLAGTKTLTVPFPTAATSLTPNLPGLSVGAVQVQVLVQTASATFSLIGSVGLTVIDTRPVPGVSSINPNSIDLVAPPATFTIMGEGFVNLGFGLPVVNFSRRRTLLAQARATALTVTTTLTVPFPTASGLSAGVGTTTLTVPFPPAATRLTPGVPGPSAGPVQVQVWQQTSAGTYSLIGTVTLTVN